MALAATFPASAQVVLPANSPGAAPALWSQRLAADVEAIDEASPADVGLHVVALGSGESLAWRSDKRWYLASMVKIPVAMAVLRGVESGTYTLETTLRLRASDYVDGAGSTNSHPVAAALSVRYLLEQMIVYSDNTASDMLIDLVGAAEVNALVAALVPQGFGRITPLGEVRRQVYGELTPQARHLTGAELIALQRQPSDAARLALLSHFVKVPVADFKRSSLDAAYNAYFAGGLNTARLDAYASLLALLVQGQALGPDSTRHLLELMSRTATGTHRIKAGLGAGMRFSHKTGTQRRIVCDAGLLEGPGESTQAGLPRRAIVVACVRGARSLALSETVLQDVGHAICRSGLLNAHPHPTGVTDEPICDQASRTRREPAAATDFSADFDEPAGPSGRPGRVAK